jgi:hypothetical protein
VKSGNSSGDQNFTLRRVVLYSDYSEKLNKFEIDSSGNGRFIDSADSEEKSVSAVVAGNRCFFTADYSGGLKQWSIRRFRLVRNYGNVFDVAITVMSVCGNFLVAPNGYGNMKQFNIKRHALFKGYPRISNNVTSLVTTS